MFVTRSALSKAKKIIQQGGALKEALNFLNQRGGAGPWFTYFTSVAPGLIGLADLTEVQKNELRELYNAVVVQENAPDAPVGRMELFHSAYYLEYAVGYLQTNILQSGARAFVAEGKNIEDLPKTWMIKAALFDLNNIPFMGTGLSPVPRQFPPSAAERIQALHNLVNSTNAAFVAVRTNAADKNAKMRAADEAIAVSEQMAIS